MVLRVPFPLSGIPASIEHSMKSEAIVCVCHCVCCGSNGPLVRRRLRDSSKPLVLRQPLGRRPTPPPPGPRLERALNPASVASLSRRPTPLGQRLCCVGSRRFRARNSSGPGLRRRLRRRRQTPPGPRLERALGAAMTASSSSAAVASGAGSIGRRRRPSRGFRGPRALVPAVAHLDLRLARALCPASAASAVDAAVPTARAGPWFLQALFPVSAASAGDALISFGHATQRLALSALGAV